MSTPRTRKSFERERFTTAVGSVSRTKQSFRDACDINAIVKKFQTTGHLAHINVRRPSYTDVSNFEDLQASLEAIASAEAGFAALPSFIRAAADNDPLRLVEMLDSEEGIAELEAVGFVNEPREDVVETPPAGETPPPEEKETPKS